MAQMKHVVVCNTNINQLIQQISCKLGTIGFNQMISEKYGVSNNCDVDTYDYNELSAYLTILENLNIEEISIEDKELGIYIDIGLVDKCSTNTDYELIIERVKDLLSNCIECKNYYDNSVIIATNNEWYETQEYIECLIQELEENGYIEFIHPIVDLCASLNIDLTVNQLCSTLVTQLVANKINCNLIANINTTNVCNTLFTNKTTITANNICETIITDIQGKLPICDLQVTLETNGINGCDYTPICTTCSEPLLSVADNICDCNGEIEGQITITNNCQDTLLYSVDGNAWTNILPSYNEIDSRLYYKCECEDSTHLALINKSYCTPFEINVLCPYINCTNTLCYYVYSYVVPNNSIQDVIKDDYIRYYISSISATHQLLEVYVINSGDITITNNCGEQFVYNLDISQLTINSEDMLIDHTYDCNTNTYTVNSPYYISTDNTNYSNTINLNTTELQTNIYFKFDLNDICYYTKLITKTCCVDITSSPITLYINDVYDIDISSPNNCEYIIDFYIESDKVLTIGFGGIFNALLENPTNTTLKDIAYQYCDGNDKQIVAYLREFKCDGLHCSSNYQLNTKLLYCNICAIPLGVNFDYDSTIISNPRDINLNISGDISLEINYNMFVIADSIEVYYGNTLIYASYDLIGTGTITVPIIYNGEDTVMVKFIPNATEPTRATLNIECISPTICEPSTDCLTLSELDLSNPILNINSDICNSYLTITIPRIQQGNSYYNDCNGVISSVTESTYMILPLTVQNVCSTNIVNYQYYCNQLDFNSTDYILITNNSNVTDLFVTNNTTYNIIKNYILSHNCNTEIFNNISLRFTTIDSNTCDENNCDICSLDLQTFKIYPCFSTIIFNDSLNTITITIPNISSINPYTLCSCEYSRYSELLSNINNVSSTIMYKSLFDIRYNEMINDYIYPNNDMYVYNTTNNNIIGCPQEDLNYYIYYHCGNNAVNSVRIYVKNESTGLWALYYQGSITWTDGRTIDSNNYLYTDADIINNQGIC